MSRCLVDWAVHIDGLEAVVYEERWRDLDDSRDERWLDQLEMELVLGLIGESGRFMVKIELQVVCDIVGGRLVTFRDQVCQKFVGFWMLDACHLVLLFIADLESDEEVFSCFTSLSPSESLNFVGDS